MPPTTQAEIIECFHLAFLTALTQRVDPASIALKGGANLRYFFDSVRYSEDIDFDVVLGADWKLRDQVGAILDSPALLRLLRSSQITIAQVNESKQTETTQRWKRLLASPTVPAASPRRSSSPAKRRRALAGRPGSRTSGRALRAPPAHHPPLPGAGRYPQKIDDSPCAARHRRRRVRPGAALPVPSGRNRPGNSR